MGTPGLSASLPRVALFLDESGTSSGDSTTLVGAVAFHDVGAAELAIKNAYDRVLGDSSLWSDPTKRQRFAKVGFHFTEDDESVRSILLAELGSLQFRAYAAYAATPEAGSPPDLLVTMYGTLLYSVLARYRDCETTVVFEQNSSMDGLYGRIWAALEDLDVGTENAAAFRAERTRHAWRPLTTCSGSHEFT
ncbi:MAG: hypothetical protein WDM88_10190 [Galbitalea sp.]